MSEDPTTTSEEDTITVTYSREEYKQKWRDYWSSVEFRLWILVSLGLIGLTMLGLIAWWAGAAVLPVVMHVEFQFPLTLVLFLCGVIVYSAVLLLLIGKTSKYALDHRRRLEHPVYPRVFREYSGNPLVGDDPKLPDLMDSKSVSGFPRGNGAIGGPENPDIESACEGLEKKLEERDRRLQDLLERNTSLEKDTELPRAAVRQLSREKIKQMLRDHVESHGTFWPDEFAIDNGLDVWNVLDAIDELAAEGYLEEKPDFPRRKGPVGKSSEGGSPP